MLKDRIEENFKEISRDKENSMNEDMGMKLKGKLEVWAYKNGELIHHDKGDNIVTKWAKHATMHLLSSESYSTHGDRTVNSVTAYTGRSIVSSDHIDGSANNDGTILSNKQYLSDNTDYYDSAGNSGTAQYKYWSSPSVDMEADFTNKGDITNSSDHTLFKYPFFPTKMLFGTGIEYASFADIPVEHQGTGQEGYGNVGNGSWGSENFDLYLNNTPINSNYYSATWDGSSYELTPTRTVNDIYSAALTTELTDESFGVKGAIKDATFTGAVNEPILVNTDGKWFADGSYRGIGRPSFIYAQRTARFMESNSEVLLEMGETIGTEDLESKITYTIVMPEQTGGEFYPYNGYTLKVAGLYADAAMLLKNTVPLNETQSENDDSDANNLEFINYKQQPGGILWATRNIAPIFKSHDTKIVAQWTIYL